jgi:hypothetical protein
MFLRTLLLILGAGLLLAACVKTASQSNKPYDLLIRNARVVDGTGNPWFYADVAVAGDRIVRVGRNLPGEARQTIDARNRILAPASSTCTPTPKTCTKTRVNASSAWA